MKILLAFAAGALLGAYCVRSEYVCLAWRLLDAPVGRRA